MTRRRVRNLLGLAVLSYLVQGPMHAYELQRRLRDNDAASTFKLSYGALYSVVQQLEKACFIEPVEVSREGQRPERTVYALTAAGRTEMHDWLCQLVAEPRNEHTAFVAALSLIAALSPDEVVDLLRRRLTSVAEEQRHMRQGMDHALGAGLHPLFLVEDEYRLGQLDAEVQFIDHFIDRITDARGGWAGQWSAFHEQSGTARTEGPET